MERHRGGSRRTTIVLADDDPRFREVVRDLLEGDGFDVVAEAADSAETVALAKQHAPDIVVMDLVMRGSDGLSTARTLLEDAPDRPVLVISTLFDPVVELEAARLGAWYLEKAEGVEALEHLINDAVAVAHPRA